jgi:hypothetical protein
MYINSRSMQVTMTESFYFDIIIGKALSGLLTNFGPSRNCKPAETFFIFDTYTSPTLNT